VTVVSAGIATGALFASLEVVGTSAAWGVAIGGGALAGLVNSGNLRGALYGAFSAAAFHGVGTYFSNIRGAAAKNLGRFGNFVKDNLRLTKTIAHGLTGGIMNELQGGKFAHGFLSAGATQALAPSIESIGIGDGSLSFGDRALRVASAAALGGAVSEVTGGKFANGAVTGAFSRGFNDELHGETDEERFRRAGLTDEEIAFLQGERRHSNPLLPTLPQGIVDGVSGFGDGVFNAVSFGFGDLNGIRRSIGIDGGVNQGSAIYRGGRVAGNIQGGFTNFGVGLRATAGFSVGRRGHFLFNSNRFFRLGPGRMPRNGGLPPGPKVPRVSIGRGPRNPHIDLRIRPFDR